MKYTTYRDLLLYAAKESDSFSLVWRDSFEFRESAHDIAKRLSPYLLSESKTSKWPGTEVFGAEALLKIYAVNNNTISILSEVSCIYEWLAPKFPEDLAFYRKGKTIFASVAHEKMAWFETPK